MPKNITAPTRVTNGKRKKRFTLDLGAGKSVEEEVIADSVTIDFDGNELSATVRSSRHLVGADRKPSRIPSIRADEPAIAAAYVAALADAGVTINEQQAIDMHADACMKIIISKQGES